MPNRVGSGPYGDGRPGRGLGNCANSRKTNIASGSRGNYTNSGFANNIIPLVLEAIRYLLTKKSGNRR